MSKKSQGIDTKNLYEYSNNQITETIQEGKTPEPTISEKDRALHNKINSLFKGYDEDGYDKNGLNTSGYNKEGYDEEGYDRGRVNKEGIHKYIKILNQHLDECYAANLAGQDETETNGDQAQ